MIEFSNERWYAFCGAHKERLEAKKTKGHFMPIEDDFFKCEWKRELTHDKRTHKCKEKAEWEFYYGIKPS